MALWAKIQSMNPDCQRQILTLYNEEHPQFKFPIELRNLFAEVIETAVCGANNITSVDGGLDPSNPSHRDPILNFFATLIGQLEERLGNAQAGDQFFTRHKLSESLTNLSEKKLSDPLGMFEHIRNRIKTEVNLVVQQEASNSTMPQERDEIMENLQCIRGEVNRSANILKEVRTNEENFALNCNKKQELEAIIANPDQVAQLQQQYPDYGTRLRDNMTALEGQLQQNIRTYQVLMQQFEQFVTNNLSLIGVLQGQIVTERLAIWKHEQQQMANGVPKVHSVILDKIQVWCEELAELIWKNYEQLKEAERILQNGIMQTGNAADLTFVQGRLEEVVRLLQDLLNHSLIVEEQPPQIIKMKTKFPKAVVVSLLVGKRLNIHMTRPSLCTCIISEEQARSLPVADRVETIGDITNGEHPMECKDDSKRLTATFRSMQLKTIRRTDRRGSVTQERVMEEKSCLYFACMATVGPLKFKVSTISLPVVVISHGSQEALAVASISWDNAFGEIGRTPFNVPRQASWAELAQVLNAKFFEASGGARGLTEENLQCLAKKAFRHRQPQPDIITWGELCKEHLPGKSFTFWTWFHAALKLIEKKETHLKELWKSGLIVGFIEREAAEALISRCEPGTFLLRFADSILGAIAITLHIRDTVVSLNPYQMLDLQSQKLTKDIKEVVDLKYLYQPGRSIPKDEAFGRFYEKETPTAQSAHPYVSLTQTVPGTDGSGSATPVPFDSHRSSHGSLPGLSPISIEQSPSPYPPSPLQLFREMNQSTTPGPMQMNGMEASSVYDAPDNSQNNFLFIPTTTTSVASPLSPVNGNGVLDTPLPTQNSQVFQFSTSETFEDLIRVIQRDSGSEVMET